MSDPDYITRDQNNRQWFTETLHGDFLTSYELRQVLFDSRTPHQRLIVADSVRFGRLVALDGVVQLTMADESAYHEMLAHVPILAHGQVESVLIIGGGDGGMAEEVLKHRSVKRLVMVEIDAGVIDFAREHLGELHRNCFDDPRFELVIADGKDYAASAPDTFDLVIVDSTDPIGPGEVLFTRSFYADCKRLLKAGGILVTQNGVPFFQADELRNTVFNFARLFADAGCYLTVVPTYVGGFMALGWGTDDESPRHVSLADLERRFAAAKLDTRYYTPAAHKGAFALPRFIEDIVEGARRDARA
jgi:spermidine synthase